MRRHRHAFPARHDMEMNVEDALARGGAIVLLEQDAVGRKRLVHRPGQFLRGRHHRRQALGRQVQDILCALLGNHQHMAFGLRHHIHESERPVVFMEFHTGNLAAQDFGKDVVGVIGHGVIPNK